MTMVIDNQGRQYGGISFDPMYPNTMHTQTHFSDPWSHQTGSANQAYSQLDSKSDTTRPALTMPYSHMPPVSAPLASGSQLSNVGYRSSDGLNVGQDMPRSTYAEQSAYSAPTTSSSHYATAYPSMNYAQSLAQQQQQQQQHQQQQRKMSEP
jgi:hypothetical protein